MNLLSILKIIIEPNRSYNVFNDDKENSFNSSIFSTLIAEYDSNGDGIISQDEYESLEKEFLEFQEATEKGVVSHNNISNFFENGIDKDELNKEYDNIVAIFKENSNLDNTELKDIDKFFKSLDSNGDSVLNLQDFYNNKSKETNNSKSTNTKNNTKNNNVDKNKTFRKEAEFYSVSKSKLNLENEYFNKLSNIDNKIDNKVNSIVKDSVLKEDYNKIRDEYKRNGKAINESEKNIFNLENKLFDTDTGISYINGQLSAISTDTDDSEVNESNKQLIVQLNNQLKELQNQKLQLEKEITNEKNNKKNLELNGNKLQQQIDSILNNMIQSQPELGDNLKHLRADKKKIELEKQNKIALMEVKAEKAKESELAKYEAMGKNSGENFNFGNEFGKKLIEIAKSEEAYKIWNGRAMSCSGFVGWCLEKLSCKVSPNMCHDIISVGKNNNAWLDVNNMSEADAKKYLVENLRPGMIFVTNTNGQLHVGFVTKVYEDGSWDTIESNTFDEKTGKSRSVASHHVTYESKKNVLLGFTDIEKLNRV